jgi:hypothetical protein
MDAQGWLLTLSVAVVGVLHTLVPDHWVPIVAPNLASRCPLWVKSRHSSVSARCPLYPQKRTLKLSRMMSALCQ